MYWGMLEEIDHRTVKFWYFLPSLSCWSCCIILVNGIWCSAHQEKKTRKLNIVLLSTALNRHLSYIWGFCLVRKKRMLFVILSFQLRTSSSILRWPNTATYSATPAFSLSFPALIFHLISSTRNTRRIVHVLQNRSGSALIFRQDPRVLRPARVYGKS